MAAQATKASTTSGSLSADRIRVVHLVSTLNIGGLEKVVYDLVRCTDRDTFSVTVLCLGEVGALGPAFEEIGVPVESLGLGERGAFGRIPAVAKRLSDLRPDILHTHNAAPHLCGAIAGWLRGGIGVVHTKHGQNRPHSRKSLLANRIAAWFTDWIVPVSNDAAEIVRNLEHVPQRKVQLIRNGVDLERFRYHSRPDGHVGSKAIHVARLINVVKDQVTLLHAVRLVANEDPSFVLDIVGDGPDRLELEELCDQLQLRPHVRFLGFRDRIHDLLIESAFFVLSSTSEGLPITLLEAMATGLPTVATNAGGIPELVVHGKTGLLVPPRSPDALASAMLEILRNPSRAREMGAASRERVAEHFDINRVTARYEELYRSLLPSERFADIGKGRDSAGPTPRISGVPRVEPIRIAARLFRHVAIPAFEHLFKRRQTTRYWRELEESQWLSADALRNRQLATLKQLLQHAESTCEYYRDDWRIKQLKPQQVESLDDFQAWPVVDRDVFRTFGRTIRSTRSHGDLILKATGGSSGVPLEFSMDQLSYERKFAAWFRGYAWAGAWLGTRHWYLWGAALGDVSAARAWKDRLYHALYRRRIANCFELSEERVPWFVADLNRYRPDCIVAYANPLYSFARALDERRIRPFSPKSIVVGAEKLHDFQRELIERVFRAPVFETYGSREFMLIGAECDRHSGLHLTMENLLVEILDDDGQPTPDGEEGNVAITDLTNYGMPFIRYLNGDRAIAGFDTCSCGRGLPLLKKVVGRRLDVLTTPDGRHVPGEFFPHLLKEIPAIRRFQVVQNDPGTIELRLVVNADWTDGARERIEREVRGIIGAAVRLELNVVDDIPLTAAGKLQVVVNNWRSTCPASEGTRAVENASP